MFTFVFNPPLTKFLPLLDAPWNSFLERDGAQLSLGIPSILVYVLKTTSFQLVLLSGTKKECTRECSGWEGRYIFSDTKIL